MQTSAQPTVSFSSRDYGSALHYHAPSARPVRSFAPAGGDRRQTDEETIGLATPPGRDTTASSESFKTAAQTPLRPGASHATGSGGAHGGNALGAHVGGAPLHRSSICTKTADGKVIFARNASPMPFSEPERLFHVVAHPIPPSAHTQRVPYPTSSVLIADPADAAQQRTAYEAARAFYSKTGVTLAVLEMCAPSVAEEDLVGVFYSHGYRSESASEDEDARILRLWQ